MELFGIGLSELLFVIAIALIVLGPKDMAATGKKMGVWLRKIVMSPGWSVFQKTSQEIRNLPNRLIREANIDDLNKEAGELSQQIQAGLDPNSIQPPQSASVPAWRTSRSIENPVAPSISDVEPKQNQDAKTS
jgi:Sec-independent protein translocase protein TatA